MENEEYKLELRGYREVISKKEFDEAMGRSFAEVFAEATVEVLKKLSHNDQTCKAERQR